jgi:hypothetical protein
MCDDYGQWSQKILQNAVEEEKERNQTHKQQNASRLVGTRNQ